MAKSTLTLLPQTACDHPDDKMSTLTSAKVLLIIFLIFMDRDAVHLYDIKHLERIMHSMAKIMKKQRYSITFKESKQIENEFVSTQKHVNYL